ncbi:hypothetical protein TL16_g09357, partial [Triparma laevis f. inornata]
KRLQQELMQLMMNSEEGTTAFPDGDNLFEWVATITGTEGTPYAGGIFLIDFNFDVNYPFKAPAISFVTKIYHPNVKSETGEICADLISNGWGPTLNVKHCLEVLRSMLITPNPDSPVEEVIASQLRDDPAAFEAMAKKWVADHA